MLKKIRVSRELGPKPLYERIIDIFIVSNNYIKQIFFNNLSSTVYAAYCGRPRPEARVCIIQLSMLAENLGDVLSYSG